MATTTPGGTAATPTGTTPTGTRARSPMPWWVFLISGTAWIVISWFVLGFDQRSLAAIAILAGVVILLAAVAELFQAFYAPGWRWLHATLAVLFLFTGFFCLFNPGSTVFWLAAFIGWYLLFKGAADIVLAFLTKGEHDGWWLGLILGIIEIIVGFWAAGRFGRSLYLLVVFVAVIALARGITDYVMAFRIRKLGEAALIDPRLTGPDRDPTRGVTPTTATSPGAPSTTPSTMAPSPPPSTASGTGRDTAA